MFISQVLAKQSNSALDFGIELSFFPFLKKRRKKLLKLLCIASLFSLSFLSSFFSLVLFDLRRQHVEEESNSLN